MPESTRSDAPQPFAHGASSRSWRLLYRPGETNHCPGCGRTHWYVGRHSAECGFCGTAIALASNGMSAGVLRQPGLGFDEAA